MEFGATRCYANKRLNKGFKRVKFECHWCSVPPTFSFPCSLQKTKSTVSKRFISQQGSHASVKVLESLGFFVYIFQALESPGKWVWSWKVLEFSRLWCGMQVQMLKCTFKWLWKVFGQFVCNFSARVINIYWSMELSFIWCIIVYIYMVNNCCLSL